MSGDSSMEDRIRARAYSLWEAGGSRHGEHEAHWHQAALELIGESAVAKKPARAKAKPAAEKAEKPAKQSAPRSRRAA